MPKRDLFPSLNNLHSEQPRENGKFTTQGESATTKLTISVTPTLRKQIEDLATSQEKSVADWVRMVLKAELAKAERKQRKLAKTIDNTEPVRHT